LIHSPAMSPLVVAQGILAVALIAAILLQQRGTGLGGAFGGEVTAYRSRRGIERTLFRLTILLAVLFVMFSLLNLYSPV
jgi:preprotein translocase subunit SecG